MITTFKKFRGTFITGVGSVSALLALFVVANTVHAAPPITITPYGPAVTTAIPGKPFMMKFHVKNTDTEKYSSVKVIFHIPDDITHSSVTPTGAVILDDTITWTDQTFGSAQSLYPSFTF